MCGRSVAVVGIDRDFEILEGDAIQPYINDMEAEDNGAMETAEAAAAGAVEGAWPRSREHV
eukprot:668253-Pyramimonas_sp.AAC.2